MQCNVGAILTQIHVFITTVVRRLKIKVLHGEKSPTNALAIKHMDKFFKCINRICSNREDPLVPEWMIDHGEQHQREHL